MDWFIDVGKSLLLVRVHNFCSLQHACFHKHTLKVCFYFISNKLTSLHSWIANLSSKTGHWLLSFKTCQRYIFLLCYQCFLQVLVFLSWWVWQWHQMLHCLDNEAKTKCTAPPSTSVNKKELVQFSVPTSLLKTKTFSTGGSRMNSKFHWSSIALLGQYNSLVDKSRIAEHFI